MRKLFLTMSLAMMTLTMMAIPAKRGQWKTVTLADGTEVKVALTGDEHGHFWQDANGNAYVMNEQSQAYQQVDKQQLLENAEKRRAQASMRRNTRLKKAQKKIGSYGDYTGSKKGLIILVEFQNVEFQEENTPELYHRIANEENFTHSLGFVGSVHDYFRDQSLGQFDLTFDVMGPVPLKYNRNYYGGNDSYGDDKRPEEMVIEACKYIDDDVDFSDYDWDGDGEVDQVFILYAGAGEANGGADETVWPHEWELSAAGKSLTLDNTRINTYGCSCELQPDEVSYYGSVYSWKIDGLGTICHEFSHCLGFPDMYDTGYTGNYGMYTWDLMDMGSYNGDGFTPAGYTSYEKMEAGWQQPIELKGSMEITQMKALSEGGETYIVYNKAHPDEYYLLENRQKTHWDKELEGNGLLIMHVDYDQSVWESNAVNTTSSRYTTNTHQRCTIFKADNKDNYSSYSGRTSSDIAGDPYPYSTNNKLTNTSSPKAELYNANSDGTKLMNVDITDITRNSNSTISFNFSDGTDGQGPTVLPEQTLSLTEIPAMTYGDEDYTLPAKTDQGLDITWTSSNTAVATVSGNIISIKKAGTANITANQAGNTEYRSFSKQFTLTVGKAKLTVTAEDKTMVQGEQVPELTVKYEGFKYQDDVSSLTKQATAKTSATSSSEPGTYTITVSGARGSNYTMSYVSGKLTITASAVVEKKEQTLDMPDEILLTYGDEPYPLPQTTNEGLAINWVTGDRTIFYINNNALCIRGAGQTTITAKQVGNDEYKSFIGTYQVNIQQAPLSVSVADCKIYEGDEIPEFEISYEGFQYNDDVSSLDKLPWAETTATSDSPVGEYPITLMGGSSQNYALEFTDGTLFILVKPVTSPDDDLTFAPLGIGRYTEFCVLNLAEDEQGNAFEPVTYEVEIEECTTIPGVYRLLNPYGPAFPFFDEVEWDATRDYHLVIHAEDPDAVYVNKQAIGRAEDGLYVYIQSLGSFLMETFDKTADEIKGTGCFGTLSNNLISFPDHGMIIYDGEDKEMVNEGAHTVVMLPGYNSAPTAIRSTNTDEQGKGHVYTLSGQRIDRTLSKKGVFIVKGRKVIY